MSISLKTQRVHMDEGGIGLYVSSTAPIGFRYLLRPSDDPLDTLLPAFDEWTRLHCWAASLKTRDKISRALCRKRDEK